MTKLILILIGISFTIFSTAQNSKQAFVSTDIDHFWQAYDKITSTEDSSSQYNYLKELYLDKASAGLKSLLEVRNYTAKEFIDAINHYPLFWRSLRPNTLNAGKLYPEIEADIQKLKLAYPNLKPSTIYFCIGAFRTGGTIQQDRVLIGAELSLADNSTIIKELPTWRQPFFEEYKPRTNIALSCTHEYIHTQQKNYVENLLSTCLYEGVAEFVSCKATGKKSNSPAIEFGKANQEQVIKQYISDLFIISNNFNWLWGENRNQFKVRDLGYYIGYEICERYYNQAADKIQAITDLVELDYTNEKEVERIVDISKFFPKTLEDLYQDYEKKRPTVISLYPFANGSQSVKPGLTKMTIIFSEPLVKHNTGVDYGPLGETYFPKLKPERTFGEDGRSWTFEAELKPNQRYQILISNNFRIESGVRLKPYLIDFKTGN